MGIFVLMMGMSVHMYRRQNIPESLLIEKKKKFTVDPVVKVEAAEERGEVSVGVVVLWCLQRLV